jgi:enoyl-CoA hydratase/carnithine racemase
MVLAKISPAAARRYFLTGERFDARTALRIGLVDEVAPDPDEAVARVVDAILAGGPTAVREAKRLVLEPGDEEDLLARAAVRRASPEGQEGLRAFLDSRDGERVRPSWHLPRNGGR